ncbi:unnamed protein product, partial [Mesorhabditis belari]|uniref:SH3 domain-containing protein n=1 Tax=Mesorhabditis belari TaxID=2138241 RepID=A0AAF3FJ66_9BILA
MSGKKILRRFSSSISEHKSFIYAEAICEFSGLHADELSFNKGDLIWVTDRASQEGRWKGIIFGQKGNSRAGYFSPSTVRMIDRPPAVRGKPVDCCRDVHLPFDMRKERDWWP